MKRVIYLILILSFIICGVAVARTPFTRVIYKPSTGGCCGTSCGLLGTEELCWDGEHTSGTTYGCISGGTQQGTLTGGCTIDTTQNHTPGGQYSITHDADNEYLAFTVTSKDIFDSSAGSFSIWIYPTASTGYTAFFEAYYDANNKFYVWVIADDTVQFQHKGNGTDVQMNSGDTVTLNQWNQIEARWSVSENKIGLRINSGSWVDDSDADNVTAFSTEPSEVRLGDVTGTFNDAMYQDDFKIWVTYDQS